MSCGVGHRCCLDSVLLWLWQRLVATALVRPLAWEPPHAVRVALKRQKTKKKKCKESWVEEKKIAFIALSGKGATAG